MSTVDDVPLRTEVISVFETEEPASAFKSLGVMMKTNVEKTERLVDLIRGHFHRKTVFLLCTVSAYNKNFYRFAENCQGVNFAISGQCSLKTWLNMIMRYHTDGSDILIIFDDSVFYNSNLDILRDLKERKFSYIVFLP